MTTPPAALLAPLRLDSLWVGLATIALSFASPRSASAALLALSSVTLLFLMDGRSLLRTLAELRGPLTFILLGTLPLAVSVSWGSSGLVLDSTREQWAVALSLAARSLSAVSGLLLVVSVAPIPLLLACVARSGLPNVFTELACLMWRWIWLLGETQRRMSLAQRSRQATGPWQARLRALASLLGVLLLNALARSRRTQAGLEARLYTGHFRFVLPHRTLNPWRLGSALLVQVLALVGSLVLPEAL